MRKLFSGSSRTAVLMLAAFVIGTMLVGVATAVTTTITGNLKVTKTVKAKNFKYLNPKTSRLVIPGAAFIGDAETDDITHTGYSGAAGCPSGGAIGCELVAPVNLPQGAVVTRVDWMYDQGPVDSATLHLESNFGDFNHDDMINVNSALCAATPCTLTTTSISPNTINNKARHYGLWLEGSEDHFTFKVVIFYKTRSVGPVSSAPDPGPSNPGTNGPSS